MCTDDCVCVSLKAEQQYDLSPNFLSSSVISILFQINGGEKRPASDMGKKPKTPKKKKKKDPNEPQKPVSAYALFFRDTQAAIKGQNPNATFGEVSKIVASMWDGLGEEQKQVRSKLEWESPRLEKVYAPPKKWLLRALVSSLATRTEAEQSGPHQNQIPEVFFFHRILRSFIAPL